MRKLRLLEKWQLLGTRMIEERKRVKTMEVVK